MPLTTTNVSDLAAAGCKLADPPMLMIGLMQYSNNEPCLTGCAYLDSGKCPAYQKYHSKPLDERVTRENEKLLRETSGGLIGGKWAGMTSEQIREKDGGISRKEFQRRKQRGDYAN